MTFRILLLLVIVFGAGCSKGPRNIRYGADGCHYCKMTIVDTQYGAEVVTSKGKVYVFDSIECMAAYEIKERPEAQAIFGKYVITLESEGKDLIHISEASIIITEKLPSPMGLNISAVKDQKTARDIALMYYGEIKSWPEIINHVRSNWF